MSFNFAYTFNIPFKMVDLPVPGPPVIIDNLFKIDVNIASLCIGVY